MEAPPPLYTKYDDGREARRRGRICRVKITTLVSMAVVAALVVVVAAAVISMRGGRPRESERTQAGGQPA